MILDHQIFHTTSSCLTHIVVISVVIVELFLLLMQLVIVVMLRLLLVRVGLHSHFLRSLLISLVCHFDQGSELFLKRVEIVGIIL